jgi:hypothetical protein
MSELTIGEAYTVNLYPNPTAPLIPLVGGNRPRRNLTCCSRAVCAAAAASAPATCKTIQ